MCFRTGGNAHRCWCQGDTSPPLVPLLVLTLRMTLKGGVSDLSRCILDELHPPLSIAEEPGRLKGLENLHGDANLPVRMIHPQRYAQGQHTISPHLGVEYQ